MALPFSIPFSILLLFDFSLLFAQLSISVAIHPVRNDRADPYCRNQTALRPPIRHAVQRPAWARYYSHKRTSSLPHQYILAEKSNNTANSTSNSTSHQTNSTTSHTNFNATSNSNTTSTNHHRRYKHKVCNWILGSIAGCLSVLISGLIVSVFFRFLLNCICGQYRSSSGPFIFTPKVIRVRDLAFLEKEDGLASLEVIGQGGSGKVYKSQLSGNPSKIVAIKQITKRAGGDPTKEKTIRLDKWMRQIKSEIKTVGYIRHKNLLPLVAHVSHSDSHFLIYEFMKNGSLLDVLMKNSESLADLLGSE